MKAYQLSGYAVVVPGDTVPLSSEEYVMAKIIDVKRAEGGLGYDVSGCDVVVECYDVLVE